MFQKNLSSALSAALPFPLPPLALSCLHCLSSVFVRSHVYENQIWPECRPRVTSLSRYSSSGGGLTSVADESGRRRNEVASEMSWPRKREEGDLWVMTIR